MFVCIFLYIYIYLKCVLCKRESCKSITSSDRYTANNWCGSFQCITSSFWAMQSALLTLSQIIKAAKIDCGSHNKRHAQHKACWDALMKLPHLHVPVRWPPDTLLKTYEVQRLLLKTSEVTGALWLSSLFLGAKNTSTAFPCIQLGCF